MSIAAKLVAMLLLGLAGFVLGTRLKQGEWDAAELERQQMAGRTLLRQGEAALAASTLHEAKRGQLAAQLRRSRDALSIALRTPISCPDIGDGEAPAGAGRRTIPLGSVVLPAGVLDGVRDAAAARAPASPASGGLVAAL